MDEKIFCETNLERLCHTFFPLLAKYEGWSPSKMQEMLASGEALQTTLVIATLIQQGIAEDELPAKIASGEVSLYLKHVMAQVQQSAPQEDPQDILFASINRGRKLIGRFIAALEAELDADVQGFAVDIASSSSFYVQNFARRWPGLKVYATEQKPGEPQHEFMKWCLDQFAESPERDCAELAKRHAAIKAGTAKPSQQVNLLDSLWYPTEPPYPDPARDSLVSSKLLDRASDLDLASDQWSDVSHLAGACRLVSLISVRGLIQSGSDDAWVAVLHRAANLLQVGGVLLLYDTVEKGGYLDEALLNDFAMREGMSVKRTSVPNDAGECALCVLKKETQTGDLDADALETHAREQFRRLRMLGDTYLSKKADRNVQSAISCYTKALDVLAVGRFQDASLASRLESDLSAALMEKERFLEALDAADNAVRLDPSWANAQFRRSKALFAMQRKEEAALAEANAARLTANADSQASATGAESICQRDVAKEQRAPLEQDSCSQSVRVETELQPEAQGETSTEPPAETKPQAEREPVRATDIRQASAGLEPLGKKTDDHRSVLDHLALLLQKLCGGCSHGAGREGQK
eukprot:TRINITY_DN30180_c0_g2_i1.p1 TRINITY_DN30180_c0_g2~~TRINITY_DN30180_c0_g2_i1.p1  ORF type:complete len:599 (-),score=86.46 TRINITY_DN30180_c0_g2_i1:126-1871(-)